MTKLGQSRRGTSWWRWLGAPSAAAGHQLAGRGALVCPRCTAKITTDRQIGYCSICRDFTGLCAAGRFATYTDIINATAWHRSCTVPGVELWQVTVAGAARRVLFCADHSAQACRAPWVTGWPVPG